MADEIDFENRHFWNFKSHVTLTLTSDDLESHIVMNVSSTLTNTTIWFVAALSLIVDVRTYVRTDGRTFLPVLLGHLWGDDLKMDKFVPHLHFWKTKMPLASGWLCPFLPHDHGLCPGTGSSAPDPPPRYKLALRARHISRPTFLRKFMCMYLFVCWITGVEQRSS